MSYDHMEWLYTAAVVPKTEAAAQNVMWSGILVALGATVYKPATVVFTMLMGQHVGTNVVQFVSTSYTKYYEGETMTLSVFSCNFLVFVLKKLGIKGREKLD